MEINLNELVRNTECEKIVLPPGTYVVYEPIELGSKDLVASELGRCNIVSATTIGAISSTPL